MMMEALSFREENKLKSISQPFLSSETYPSSSRITRSYFSNRFRVAAHLVIVHGLLEFYNEVWNGSEEGAVAFHASCNTERDGIMSLASTGSADEDDVLFFFMIMNVIFSNGDFSSMIMFMVLQALTVFVVMSPIAESLLRLIFGCRDVMTEEPPTLSLLAAHRRQPCQHIRAFHPALISGCSCHTTLPSGR